MFCIVPLAGPDFVHSITKEIKPLMSVNGQPLLLRAITSRPWWRSGQLQPEGLIFVLRNVPEASLVCNRLDKWFPGSQKVILSSLTGGALMSALAGVSLVKDLTTPLCVDLVDIFYETEELIIDRFDTDGVGAVVPYFYSQESCYSYFKINGEGLVIRAVEKQVISDHASAGTYFFRDAATYLKAVAFSLENITDLSVNGVLFVCPAMNYLVSIGEQVLPIEVGSIKSVSKMFH